MIEIGQLFVDLFFGTVVFGGIGGIVWKIRRENVDDVTDMRSVALVRIADARDEQMLRVAGRVVADPGELVTAPVSGKPCVAWTLEITAQWRAGRDVVLDRQENIRFFVDDGSGRAQVAAKVTVWALATRDEGTGDGDEVPPTLAAWLEENHASDEWRTIRNLRWRESRVEPGESVGVVGVAHVSVDTEAQVAGYRDPPKLVTIGGSDDAPLSLSDHPSLR